MKKFVWLLVPATLLFGCAGNDRAQSAKKLDVKLITLDPGHFHAALVQKQMYEGVDSVVHVYAPKGPDLQQHLQRVEGYNTRADNPTHWKEEVYAGNDFLEKMLADNKATSKDTDKKVVVISGNNQKKTEYILKSVEAGLNVLSDKPMAINKEDFDKLKTAFDQAKKNDVLLYDIMTERYEITSILQRELSLIPEIFGEPEKGTPENPGITKESVHYFYKYVSGSILTRPAWFMDVAQQGEGITDVTTHLVDLVQWECFPEAELDYTKDVTVHSARRWPTQMSQSQFSALTKLDSFPGYLKKDLQDGILNVYSNGEINYSLRGMHAKVSVEWGYQAPEGAGDTHFSVYRGTKSNLAIRQGEEQNYKPLLYIERAGSNPLPDSSYIMTHLQHVIKKYPGIAIEQVAQGWEVTIPDKYKEGHEAHFGQVTQKYLEYLKQGSMPKWEVDYMLTKYFTTTAALEMAQKKGSTQK